MSVCDKLIIAATQWNKRGSGTWLSFHLKQWMWQYKINEMNDKECFIGIISTSSF
jgi:hypothetical protein